MSKIKGSLPGKAQSSALVIAGVDVGLGGAVALLDENDTVQLFDMPVLRLKPHFDSVWIHGREFPR